MANERGWRDMIRGFGLLLCLIWGCESCLVWYGKERSWGDLGRGMELIKL